MSGFLIVPDTLHAAINARLDAAIAKVPGAAIDRDNLYAQLLNVFNEYGVLPEFEIVKNDTPEKAP